MKISSKEYIIIKGAKLHNLKNVSLNIPKNKLIVFSGVSGSGKSSLVFNTIFAEGQRRYIQSLSSYARQFLEKIQKPDVISITGLSPAISITQKGISKNPRSTIGTTTEIYDYLKMLFSKIGRTYSPISNKEVKRNDINDVMKCISRSQSINYVLTKIKNNNIEELKHLSKKGYSRILINNKIKKIHEIGKIYPKDKLYIIIDRFQYKIHSMEERNRIINSIETAFIEGNGECIIQSENQKNIFSNKLEMDNIKFEEPSTHLFSFNNPYGACKKCKGFGTILDVDEDKIVPNKILKHKKER